MAGRGGSRSRHEVVGAQHAADQAGPLGEAEVACVETDPILGGKVVDLVPGTGLDLHDEGIGTVATVEVVQAGATDQDVGATVAIDDVGATATVERIRAAVSLYRIVEVIARPIEVRRAGQLQLLEKCAKRVADRTDDIVDAAVVDPGDRFLADQVARIVDAVDVVPGPAIHLVLAGATVEQIIAGAAIELVIAAQGVKPVLAAKTDNLFVGTRAYQILGVIRSDNGH